MTTALLILTLFTVTYTMIAKRLASTVLTAPMLFIAFGYLLAQTGLMPHQGAEAMLHLVAEVALILLLFLDAAQINLSILRKQHVWPVRMLLVGLPLSIAVGTLAAWPFLPGWPIFAVALVAALLAPTDAALGQAVVANPVVPARARRALTVESGLNDGLALPAVLLFADLTAYTMQRDNADWLWFAFKQLTLGPLVGAIIGLIGGTILLRAKKFRVTSETYEGIGVISLAGAAYLAAQQIGGNGFISAFIAGLCFGNVVQGQCKFIYEFTESEGQLLSWAAFFLLGLALVPQALEHLTLAMLALILVSLVIVRPLAIWLSCLFFGWFGPRGLATALFALLIVHKTSDVFADEILALAVNAVWISALLHGLSAVPGAKWYAAKVEAMGDCPEAMPIESSARPLTTMDT